MTQDPYVDCTTALRAEDDDSFLVSQPGALPVRLLKSDIQWFSRRRAANGEAQLFIIISRDLAEKYAFTAD